MWLIPTAKVNTFSIVTAPQFPTVPSIIFCISALLFLRSTTAATIDDWQLDPIKNALYRTPELKSEQFEKPNNDLILSGATRLTPSKRGSVLVRRNIETVDPFKNCYFSPVQCVFYEDRKK